jgi:hypothetical protein
MACDMDLDESHEEPVWLKAMLNTADGQWDDFYYRQSIKLLERYVFVQRMSGDWAATTMPSIIQWRARKADAQEGLEWARWVWWITVAAVAQINRDKGRPMFRRHPVASLRNSDVLCSDRHEVGGNDERKLAWGWIEIAEVFHREGVWCDAAGIYKQVVEVRKRLLAEEHSDTLTSIANLESAYRSQGQWKEAEALEVQVKEIRIKVLGKEYADTLKSLANLEAMYNQQGRLRQAEELLR